MKNFDIVIIGSGIAGISVGALLSKKRSVCIIEKEREISYHSTGRSFAFFIESYGNEIIRNLTRISKEFFYENFNKYLSKKGVLYLGNKNQTKIVKNFFNLHKNSTNLEFLDKSKTLYKVDCLKEEYVNSSVLDVNACQIDVNNLYEYYRKKFIKNKGIIKTYYDLKIVNRENEKWILNNDIKCDIIINAAGAWADEIANLFKIKKINIVPKKRTVFVFNPLNMEINPKWPLVADIEENFYFKDQSKKIYASPADETPTFPHDCYPDEIDIASGADKILKATNFEFRSIENQWSGLRSFVFDKSPVVGFDNNVQNFFWLVAQGGYGIQTAPALAIISSHLILNKGNYNLKNYIDYDKINVVRIRK
jgi:D-arginine dehydrogenase